VYKRQHPLFQRLNVIELALTFSSECNAQLAIRAPGRRLKPSVLKAAVQAFAGWPAWSTTPEGRFLHAKALAALGQTAQARKVLGLIAGGPYNDHWRGCAGLEAEIVRSAVPEPGGRRCVTASFVKEAVRIDGRLDEPAWAAAPRIALLAADGKRPPKELAGWVKVIRTHTAEAAFAVCLPAAEKRTWELTIAIDADRDTWTQLLLGCNTRGQRSSWLSVRHGPAARLNDRGFPLQAVKAPIAQQDAYTFEGGFHLRQVAPGPLAPALWNFQVLATAREDGRAVNLFFRPQDDERMLPERYGLLQILFAPGQ